MKPKMSPQAIKAKMAVLDELLNMSNGMESDDLENHFKDLKKVTVASNDKAGLEKGLAKAKDMISSEESSEDESMESPKEEKIEDAMDLESLHDDMKDMKPEIEMSLPEDKSKAPYEEDEDMKKIKMKNSLSKKKKGFLSDII